MNYKTSHNQRQARILLEQAKDEESLLSKRDLHPVARKLLKQSIEGKLATIETLRTGRKPSASSPVERSTEVYQ